MIGIRVHAPVELIKIFINGRSDIDHGLLVPAQLLVLLTVDDVSAGGLEMIGGDQDLLHNILDLFDIEEPGRITVINDLNDF